MTIKRRVKKKYEENSVLSDLAFLLIIYFIVIAGFNINKGFLMNLPAKDSTRIVSKNDILRYELDSIGRILSNGNPVDIKTVERNITVSVALNPNLAVALIISPEAPWQSVVSFVELAQKLKIESFSFKMDGNG
ncbi:MAG: biopolymer transporter ExbD [Spirochaetaceae bacterium]|jgi:biopolymer transport protein ExbD|nr:biopolymer transporter ExbD [Spirochaetaceae bacterium]